MSSKRLTFFGSSKYVDKHFPWRKPPVCFTPESQGLNLPVAELAKADAAPGVCYFAA
jgi:hypothetical protein